MSLSKKPNKNEVQKENICRFKVSLESYFLILKEHGCVCYTTLTCPKVLSEARWEFYSIKTRIYVLITRKYMN